MRSFVLCLLALFAVLGFAQQVPPGEQIEVMVPMRDGVPLHTIVNLPNRLKWGHTNLTCVLDRSPYGEDAIELFADIYLEEGLAGVRQDMRGTKKSDGVFTIWHQDADDAYDTMEWISQQPWSNGIVFSIGASADGLSSFCAVQDQPPWLEAQFVIWTSSVGYPVIYPGGAYLENLVNSWMKGTVPKNSTALINEIQANEQPGQWWDALNLTGKYDYVDFPSLMWGGWYDIFIPGSLIGFQGYQTQSQPQVRDEHTLVVDPLGHCQEAYIYFGENLVAGRIVLPIYLSFDLFLGRDTRHGNVSSMTWYIMGADSRVYHNASGNYWTTLDAWPATVATTFYLDGFRTLLQNPTDSLNGTSSFVYDPKDPVPTVGGNNLFLPCGPLDQRAVEQGNRTDVLTWTSAPLSGPMAVMGSVVATLYVASDQVDTDFTVKLTDVYPFPNEHSRLIQDGIVRMRWREYSSPKNMTPGHVYEVKVELWNTSYVFSAGHKLRISISSSNYPRFSVNPNNGWPLNTTEGSQGPLYVAHNTIYHSHKYPSQITFPVADLKDMPATDVNEWIDKVAEVKGQAFVDKLLSPENIKRTMMQFDDRTGYLDTRVRAAKEMGSSLLDSYPY